MTIKRKLYSIALGEMIVFLIIAAVVVGSFLPIIKLNNQTDQLSDLNEKLLVTRVSLTSMITSPLSLKYEELKLAKEDLTNAFSRVDDLTALRAINSNVDEAITAITQLEDIFNVRWAELEKQAPQMLDDAQTVMFSKAVPLLRFYQFDYSRRVKDMDAILFRVESFIRSIDIAEGTLSSAYQVATTQFAVIEKELNRKIRTMVMRSVIIFVVMMVVIIIIASRMASGMAGSIASFVSGVTKLREGRLDADFNIRTKDEIGQLGENLTSFSEALSASISKIKQSSGETLHMKDELSGAAADAQSSVKGIAEDVSGIREGMVDLDGRVAESGSAVTTVKSQTGELKTMLEEQNAMIEESTSSVTEMIASISNVSDITSKKKLATKELVRTAGEGGVKLNETINVIQEITSNIDEIRGTASIIQSVAAQTSLLAMNAAIEAAHAGEYGAGFSVVAEEIRKLAEASGLSSKRISGVLKDVIMSIEQAAESGEETKKAFIDINREVTDVAGALDEISSSMDELSVGGKQILEAMNSLQGYTSGVQEGGVAMTLAAGSLEEAFRLVERVTSGVLSRISGIGKRMDEITGVISTVSAISGRLSSESVRLEEEVARFSIGEASDVSAVENDTPDESS